MRILFIFVLILSCAAILAFVSNLLNSGDRTNVDFTGGKRREDVSAGKELKNIFWFVQVNLMKYTRTDVTFIYRW